MSPIFSSKTVSSTWTLHSYFQQPFYSVSQSIFFINLNQVCLVDLRGAEAWKGEDYYYYEDYYDYEDYYEEDDDDELSLNQEDQLTERQDLVTSSLGLGLILTAISAAVVGSLLASGLTSLTNIRVSFHADEIGDITIPFFQLMNQEQVTVPEEKREDDEYLVIENELLEDFVNDEIPVYSQTNKIEEIFRKNDKLYNFQEKRLRFHSAKRNQ